MNIFVNVEDAKRLGLMFLIEYGRKNIKDDSFCANFLGKFGNACPEKASKEMKTKALEYSYYLAHLPHKELIKTIKEEISFNEE